MTVFAAVLVAAPIVMFAYAYVVYPVILRIAGSERRDLSQPSEPREWPAITVVIAAYNAEHTIGRTLDQLLAADYPADRRQIIVVSDASTDGTADVVARFADRGVELLQLTDRGGKTAAENRVADQISGEIVIGTDASIAVPPSSLKTLVRHFADASIGVASGWAVGATRAARGLEPAEGDAGYFRYEMWVRSLESRFGGIMGAMGGLYAIRRELFRVPLPPHIARDFASTLVARERGQRSIIDRRATCPVGRSLSLRAEFERKARTMLNGLDTLRHFSHLMDPTRHGAFAFMLLSHKLCRWLVYLLAPPAAVGLSLLARDSSVARAVLAAGLVAVAGGIAAMRWRPADRRLATPLSVLAYATVGAAAGMVGWMRFFLDRHATTWTPTRRGDQP